MTLAADSPLLQCLPKSLPLLSMLENRVWIPSFQGSFIDKYIAQPTKEWYYSKTNSKSRKEK